jgi:endonuclease YncB( thermonuclease family)
MDGDTFEFEGVMIRLADVDAPEMSQKCDGGPEELRNCGEFVADTLAARIRGQPIECEVHAIDDYERRLNGTSASRSPNRKESGGSVTRPKRWQRDGGRR